MIILIRLLGVLFFLAIAAGYWRKVEEGDSAHNWAGGCVVTLAALAGVLFALAYEA